MNPSFHGRPNLDNFFDCCNKEIMGFTPFSSHFLIIFKPLHSVLSSRLLKKDTTFSKHISAKGNKTVIKLLCLLSSASSVTIIITFSSEHHKKKFFYQVAQPYCNNNTTDLMRTPFILFQGMFINKDTSCLRWECAFDFHSTIIK